MWSSICFSTSLVNLTSFCIRSHHKQGTFTVYQKNERKPLNCLKCALIYVCSEVHIVLGFILYLHVCEITIF